MRRLLLPGALFALASACEPVAREEPVDSFAVAVEARGGTPFDSTQGPVVTLVLPDSAAQGAKVPVKIRVANQTAAPMDLYVRGREIAFDIVVTDSTGDTVWRRLEGEVVPAILQLKTLAPGEAFEVEHEWDQKAQTGTSVLPGAYGVRGSILTDGQRLLATDKATVIIRPR